MPDMNDFYAFKSTSGGGGFGGGAGFSIGCLPWIFAVLLILFIIGKLVG